MNDLLILKSGDKSADDKPIDDGYKPLQRKIELIGVTLFFGLMTWSLATLAARLQASPDELSFNIKCFLAILSGLVGMFAADLLSGVVHWAADNYGKISWPILGPGFIQPFRHHHVAPKELTHHDFLQLNGNNCIVSLPVIALALASLTFLPAHISILLAGFNLSLATWVFLTNQIHSWAHSENEHLLRPVKWLQKTSLILSAGHHQKHHDAPHNSNYAITGGWVNPLLTALYFFPILEWIIFKLSGVGPLHGQTALPNDIISQPFVASSSCRCGVLAVRLTPRLRRALVCFILSLSSAIIYVAVYSLTDTRDEDHSLLHTRSFDAN